MREYLRRYREMQGMSIPMLSKKANVSIGYISKIENGYNMPSILVAKCLFKALGVDMEIILPDLNVNLFTLSRETGIPVRQLLDPITELSIAKAIGCTVRLNDGAQIIDVAL